MEKFYINYNEKDLEGYFTGVGGMVCYDENSITNSDDYALTFDTEKEAKDYIEKHNDEWKYGELSYFKM